MPDDHQGGRQPTIRLGWWLSSEEHDPRDLVRQAEQAEGIGITTAMISDHLRPWARVQGQASHVWTVVGAICHATEQLQIGTGVTAIVHRRSPIDVAHAAATAAVMSDGRFFLGVGTGERLNEQPMGRRWPAAAERRDILAEVIPLLRQLWAGETVNHRGTHFQIERLQLSTLPAAPPPIFFASSGAKSAQLAGQSSDGLIAVEPDAKVVDVFRGAGGEGKPCMAQLHVCIAATDAEARDTAWRWWPNAAVPPSVLSELATPAEFEAVAEAAGPAHVPDVVVCAADAAPLVAAIDRFVGAGFDTVYLHQVGPDQQRLRDVMRQELLPHYADR